MCEIQINYNQFKISTDYTNRYCLGLFIGIRLRIKQSKEAMTSKKKQIQLQKLQVGRDM